LTSPSLAPAGTATLTHTSAVSPATTEAVVGSGVVHVESKKLTAYVPPLEASEYVSVV
jgi:hypothetical protein